MLLSGNDEVEVAVIERNPVSDGSIGQDEIAEFIEDTQDCKPESGVHGSRNYLASVKTIYAFQHLQGAETEEGSNALHALRSALWERGDAIMQADGEGFTNEEGYHIVWQFSDSVSGPWNMGVLQDGVWHHFTMDLGDPDHRAAFLEGDGARRFDLDAWIWLVGPATPLSYRSDLVISRCARRHPEPPKSIL